MIRPELIEKMIPQPSLKKVSEDTLGKPWWLQMWIYFTVPTKFMLVGNWKISLPNGMRILIPDEFIFDGASIPWYMRWLMTSFGPLLRGAIFHDFGYRHDFLFDWQGTQFALKRGQEFYDDLFRQIVIWTTGLVPLAYIAWAGVRFGGAKAWNEHRKNDEVKQEKGVV